MTYLQHQINGYGPITGWMQYGPSPVDRPLTGTTPAGAVQVSFEPNKVVPLTFPQADLLKESTDLQPMVVAYLPETKGWVYFLGTVSFVSAADDETGRPPNSYMISWSVIPAETYHRRLIQYRDAELSSRHQQLAGTVFDPSKVQAATTNREKLLNAAKSVTSVNLKNPQALEDLGSALLHPGTRTESAGVWFGKDKWEGHPTADDAVRIGASVLPVAPEQIQVQNIGQVQESLAMRRGSSKLRSPWAGQRMVSLSCVFPNDTEEAAEEARRLIVQLRTIPFLPVSWGKHLRAELVGIDALAIQQVIVTTIPQLPRAYRVDISAYVFDWQYYLKDPDKLRFEDYFIWPIYNKWIDQLVQRLAPRSRRAEGLRISIGDENRLRALVELAAAVNSVLTPDNPDVELEQPTGGSGLQSAPSVVRAMREDNRRNRKPLTSPRAGNYADPHQEPVLYRSLDGSRRVLFYVSSYTANDGRFVQLEDLGATFHDWPTVDTPGVLFQEDPYYTIRGGISGLGHVYTSFRAARKQVDDYAISVPEANWTATKELIGAIHESVESKYQATGETTNVEDFLANPNNREVVSDRSMRAEQIQVVFTHLLSAHNPDGSPMPVFQYWGSPSIEVAVDLTSPHGLASIHEAYLRTRRYGLTYDPQLLAPSGLESNFWLIEDPVLDLLGLDFFQPVAFQTSSVPGSPHVTQARVAAKAYLRTPVESPELVVENVQTSSFKGFQASILEEIYVEERLKELPLYPDLRLPTYRDLARWLAELALDGHELELYKPAGSGKWAEPDFYISSQPAEELYEYDRLMQSLDRQVMHVLDRFGGREELPMTGPGEELVLDGEAESADAEADPLDLPDPEFPPGVPPEVEPEAPPEGVTEAPDQDAGVYTRQEAARSMFYDHRLMQPMNRLARAYPTYLMLFYREGTWTASKRLWDHVFGQIAIREINVTKDYETASDTAVIGISEYSLGLLSQDAERTLDMMGKTSRPARGKGYYYSDRWAESADKFSAAVHGNQNTWSDEYHGSTRQRWQDLSNALVIAAGTRVHIRQGYGSSPSRIPTTFNGTIAEVQITDNGVDVVASGDGQELDGDLFAKEATHRNREDEKDIEPIWEKIRPRAWILDVLNAYDIGMATRLRDMVKGAFNRNPQELGIAIGHQRYSIEHYGRPLPANRVAEEITGDGDTSTLGRIYQGVGAGAFTVRVPLETGQNVYSERRADRNWGGWEDEVLQDREPLPRPFSKRDAKLKINVSHRSFWDICNDLAGCIPGFLRATRPYGIFRSTFFFGRPHWPLTFRYGLGTEDRQRLAGGGFKTDSFLWSPVAAERNSDPSGLILRHGYQSLGVRKAFSQYHLAIPSSGLLTCRLQVDDSQIVNKVLIHSPRDDGTLDETQVGAYITPGENVIELTVDDDIIPEDIRVERVVTPFQWKTFTPWTSGYTRRMGRYYGAEYMARTLRTMYAGKLHLQGNGSVSPWDHMRIGDPISMTSGTVMVRRVQHLSSHQMGFSTVVTPGCVAWCGGSGNLEPILGGHLLSGMIAAEHLGVDFERERWAHLRDITIGLLNRVTSDLPAGQADELIRKVWSARTPGSLRTAIVASIKLVYATAAKQPDPYRASLRASCKNVQDVLNLRMRFGKTAASGYTLDLLDRMAADMEMASSPLERKALEGAEARVRRPNMLSELARFSVGMAMYNPYDMLGRWLLGFVGIGRGAKTWVDDHTDQVKVLLLQRNNREMQAGLTNHQGAVLGECGSAMNELAANEWIQLFWDFVHKRVR